MKPVVVPPKLEAQSRMARHDVGGWRRPYFGGYRRDGLSAVIRRGVFTVRVRSAMNPPTSAPFMIR
jgi:hypothetical protein